MTGDVIVEGNGGALHIEAGAVVRFTPNTRLTLRNGARLNVNGTSAQPVLLTSNEASPQRSDWEGIDVECPPGEVQMTHAVIEYARVGLNFDGCSLAENHSVTNTEVRQAWGGIAITSSVQNSVFNEITIRGFTSYGLRAAANPFQFDRFVIDGEGSSGSAVYAFRTFSVLKNFLITDAAFGVNAINPSRFEVWNSTINGTTDAGIRLEDATGAILVRNSTITVSSGDGVRHDDNLGTGAPSNVTVEYSNVVAGAGAALAGGVTCTTSCTNVAPGFVDESAADFRLLGTSPLIDSGRDYSDVVVLEIPTLDLGGDPRLVDGDRNGAAEYDIGAYEYLPPVVCGDGFVEAAEVCDDGTDNGSYGFCLSDCSGDGPYCGDASTNGPEECDDGNTDQTDSCLNDCTSASCGDGAVWVGTETCDDGSDNGNYGSCAADCLGPGARCGDGLTNGPEECDDANIDESDACLSSCTAATCGDGFVYVGMEQCDDGNQSDEDGCTSACEPAICGDGYTYGGVEESVMTPTPTTRMIASIAWRRTAATASCTRASRSATMPIALTPTDALRVVSSLLAEMATSKRVWRSATMETPSMTTAAAPRACSRAVATDWCKPVKSATTATTTLVIAAQRSAESPSVGMDSFKSVSRPVTTATATMPTAAQTAAMRPSAVTESFRSASNATTVTMTRLMAALVALTRFVATALFEPGWKRAMTATQILRTAATSAPWAPAATAWFKLPRSAMTETISIQTRA